MPLPTACESTGLPYSTMTSTKAMDRTCTRHPPPLSELEIDRIQVHDCSANEVLTQAPTCVARLGPPLV